MQFFETLFGYPLLVFIYFSNETLKISWLNEP